MKKIAFIFTTMPYGNSVGKEGQEMLLATSELINDINIFFISDGIYQILDKQKPNYIKSKNYTTAFKILQYYKIKNIYLCLNSLKERGINKNSNWIINPIFIDYIKIRDIIAKCNVILRF